MMKTRQTDRASSPETKILELWQAVPFLNGLAPEIVQALAQVASRHSYSAGAMLFMEGEPGAGLFLVEEGSVKVCRVTREGREHTLHVFRRGDTFNDVSALDGGSNPATALAYTDVTIWRITRSDLQKIAERHPTLAWALLTSIAQRTRYLVNLVQDLSARNVKARLARLLLEQAQNNVEQAAGQLLTQEEMASRLGTVREVVGRALRSLVAAGIISFDRHRIVILDRERLAEEADL
jgi:CRP/FNR family transcriptional regulator